MRGARGRGLVIAAVAVATAALWLSFGLHYATERDLRQLVERVGIDLFYVHKRPGEHFSQEELKAVAKLTEVAMVAGEGSQHTAYFPGQEYTLTTLKVSPEYLSLLRLSLQAGRGFSAEEAAVAVLGAQVKEVLFKEREAVGQQVEIAGVSYTVIGVLAPIPTDDGLRSKLNSLVLVPLGKDKAWALFVRAKESVPKAQEAIRKMVPGVTFRTVAERYEIYLYLQRVVSWLLFIIAGGLSLIAAVTASGLVAVLSLWRGWEIGVRRAVGATVAGIIRLLTGEICRITGLGAAAGTALGAAISHLFLRLGWETQVGSLHLLVSIIPVAAGAIASVYPAWKAARIPPAQALALRTLEARRALGLGVGNLTTGVAVLLGTSTLTFLLLFLATTEAHLAGLWGEMDQRVLLVQAPRKSIFPPPELSPRDLTRLLELPGVELAVLGSARALGPGWGVYGLGVGYTDLRLFALNAGRDLTEEEVAHGRPVALVGKSFAQERGGQVLGETIRIRGQEFTIVGVFDDTVARFYLGFPVVVPYESLKEIWLFHQFWVRVKEGHDVTRVKEEITSVLQNIYPNKAQVEVVSPGDELARGREFTRGLAARLGAFAGLGYVAAIGGMFNLVSFVLLLRMRELGIRRAVGAKRKDLVKLGIGEAAKVAIVAVSLGVGLGAWGAASVLDLFWIDQPLQISWIFVPFSLAIICTLIAGGWPAWRAATFPPAWAIREGRR